MSRVARWLGVLLISILLLLFGVAPLFAQTFTPVFTRQYARAAGPPVTVSDTFSACDPSGPFRLVVLNGPEGRHRISSGSLVVNGLEVLRERDFNQRVARIERPLTNILEDNRLEVELRSKPGAAIQVTIEGIQACGARITSPAPGSTLTEPLVLVRGTVQVPPNGNVGVTVNGVPALVEAGQYAALVPVSPEMTSLTARAADLSGHIGSDTIPVTVRLSTLEPRLRLDAIPPGGVAPLTIGFSLSSVIPVFAIALDFDGNGSVDFEGDNLDGRTFTFTRPGLYTSIVQVTDDQGKVHTAATLVQVSDPAVLDARLQAVWQGLKDALRSGDLSRARTFIHSEARTAYADQLNRFNPATLANIDRHMTAIQLVEVGPGGAQYEMLRERDGQPFSFAVWFQLDQDGLWRIRRF